MVKDRYYLTPEKGLDEEDEKTSLESSFNESTELDKKRNTFIKELEDRRVKRIEELENKENLTDEERDELAKLVF